MYSYVTCHIFQQCEYPIERINKKNLEFFLFHRSTLPLSATEQKELNEMEEPLGTSPPLELRRTVTGQRIAVPHSLQSPQDRATGNFNWKT